MDASNESTSGVTSSDVHIDNDDRGDAEQDVDPVRAEAEQCDISDDEEALSVPEDEQVPSYFFEDDDEIEEYMRSLEIGCHRKENFKKEIVSEVQPVFEFIQHYPNIS